MEHRILPLPRQTQRLVLRIPSPASAAALQEALEESYADLRVWMEFNVWRACPGQRPGRRRPVGAVLPNVVSGGAWGLITPAAMYTSIRDRSPQSVTLI
jgi:hypothetical protein